MFDLTRLREAVRHEGGITRRLFLSWGAALASLPSLSARASPTGVRPSFPADPFSVGVASGDPDDTSVVLWTRLAPKPLEEGGGLPPDPVDVRWEIAEDENLRDVVGQGTVVATPQLGHSVHVEARGLQPDRWYWYRFRAGDAVSPVGRTRTMPAPHARPDRLRFAFASCQHYEAGLYTAYKHMAADEPDLVFHLGDYIYEDPGRLLRPRRHVRRKLVSLEDFRIRHAQYRSDPLLHGMHARCPWVVTWDDHEFENNCAGPISERKGADPAAFLEMRANAYQAYYEMMPLRPRSLPHGPDMTIYRTINFGRLAGFQVLDTRQYRTDQPNGDRASDLNEEALDPHNSLLGAKQAGWMKAALLRSTARWNVLAQQVMMGMADVSRTADKKYSMDQWPSAAFERMKLAAWMAERRVSNPVVLTGDIHSSWVNDIRVDDRKPETPVVATEFVGTSISSGGNGQANPKDLPDLLKRNPFVKFHNRQRGYVRCTVTPDLWRSDYVVVEDVLRPGAPAVVKGSFAVEHGRPGARAV